MNLIKSKFIVKDFFFKSIIFTSSLLLFIGCEGVGGGGVIEIDPREPLLNTAIPFQGIDASDQISDSSARLVWTNNLSAIGYELYNTTSGIPVFEQFIFAPATSLVLNGLTPSTSYSYRLKMKTVDGFLDTNTKDESFITNTAPNSPSTITMFQPTLATGIDVTPTLRVSGVNPGETVRLFLDSSCTSEVGSAISTESSVEITTMVLTPGVYSFYANTTNTSSTVSNCSSVNAFYTLSSCPSEWVRVEGSSVHGTDAFCIMKYEAKNIAGVPTSQANNAPWVNIDQQRASLSCRTLGVDYDLVSNPEWMTMAHDIESVDANWSGGSVGSGCLFRGNAGLDDACGYDGVNSEYGSGRDSRASFELSNGEVIWDLSGNVWEWIDWTKGGFLTQIDPSQKAYDGNDSEPVAGYIELPLIDSNIESGKQMASASWKPTDATLDTTDGIGAYFGGLNISGGTPLRGGGVVNGAQTGLYALVLDYEKNGPDVPIFFGFRCVYRPK
jgi:hypothetical protein